MVSVWHHRFEVAAVAIFIALIADGLDGRVARLTNTQTEFGVQYDSLADMVTFGVGVSLLVYIWSLASLGKIGWLVAFLFVAATALRLARFNTQTVSTDKRYFQGLPCPAAAAVLASIIWLAEHADLQGVPLAPLMLVITLGLAFAMVSNLRYQSFKQLDKPWPVSFVKILLVVLVVVAIALDPPIVLCIAFVGYALSGPVLTILHLRRKRRVRHKTDP